MKTHTIKFADNWAGKPGYVSIDGRKYWPSMRQVDALLAVVFRHTMLSNERNPHFTTETILMEKVTPRFEE